MGISCITPYDSLGYLCQAITEMEFEDMSTKKDNALGLYMEGIRDGKPREALTKYIGQRYT